MTEYDPDREDYAEIIHAMEQLSAFIRDMAPPVWSYYQRLQGEGFTEEQAFTLARDLQQQLMPDLTGGSSDD